MKVALSLVLLTVVATVSACDECSGTPSCRGAPEIGISGQIIEHKSGTAARNVRVAFLRDSGAELAAASVEAMSDGGGFFQLRAHALQAGAVFGALQVTPPPPFAPYLIRNLTLEATEMRGNGQNLGRIVVNPYLLLIGVVRDRRTQMRLPDVTVTMRRISGGRVEGDSMTFRTDFGGQFSWEPAVLDPQPILAEFTITAPGYPRPFIVQRELEVRYKDQDLTFAILPVGSGLAYYGFSVRRGSGEHVPGVVLEFARVSGIAIQPPVSNLALDGNASFTIPVEPLEDGALTAELRVLPPPRFPAETTLLQLHTSDDDVPQSLGFFRYGAQVYLTAQLRDATGQALAAGTEVVLKRTGGQSLDWPTPAPDGDLRQLSSNGMLEYHAPTTDSGATQFDMIVRLPDPFAWDTLRNLVIPARYSDSAFAAGVLTIRRRPRP